jgi:hypothetical protein
MSSVFVPLILEWRFEMKNVVLVLLFLILALVTAVPAGAVPPENIDIVSETRFFFWDFYNPAGTWESSGVVNSNGWNGGSLEHFGAGWPHGIGFKTAHVVTILADDQGTMTVRIDANGFEWDVPCDEEDEEYEGGIYDECYTGTGNWRILSGTGAYADLHGQGEVSLTGSVDWDALIMDTVEEFHGLAHFDPY